MVNQLHYLTKNFTLEEFACKDGTPVPATLFNNVFKLAIELQKLRDLLTLKLGKDCPIHINSAYRTLEYNKTIEGSAPHSHHMKAEAADCTCVYFTPDQFADLVEQFIKERKVRFRGIGRYRGFTHIDVREYNRIARWDYRT